MVKLHCTVPSDPFPFLSLDGLHFFSCWAVWLPAPGAVVPDAWLGSTPPTNSPFTQGLDVLWLCSSNTLLFYLTHRHSFRATICTSCICYFLFPIQPSFSPFSRALLCLISCPSKTTSLQQPCCPILFFFLSETVDFLLSLDIVTSLSTHKMPSRSIPLSSASITHPVCSSQYPAPPEPYVC